METIRWTESQQAAIDARGCALAVSAAAGSGKTAVLTQRIIEKLWAGEDISRMLVVTFTNDAAADLREKIRSALSKALLETPDSRHMSRQLIKLSGAKISTISSFCLSLVKANYRAAGLPSDFGVLSETQDVLLRKNVADELISDFFYGRVPKEEADIADFAAFADTFGKPGSDEALTESVSNIYDKLSSTALFEETLAVWARELDTADDFTKTKFGKSALSYVLKFCVHYRKIFDAMVAYASLHDEVAGYSAAYAEESSFLFGIEAKIERGAPWSEIRGDFVSHSFAKLGRAARGYVPTAEVAYFRDARESFKADYKVICAEIFVFGDGACAEGAEMLQKALTDLYQFIKIYKRRLDAEKRRRHAISFADIEHKALSLVCGEDGEPTPLALSMREDFDEIYIDEYQDTNEVQDKIFTSLSRGDNRFVVGDIKQCIYAFRSADPSIFEALINRSSKYEKESTEREQKIFLSQNFRSTDEILEFTNAVFEKQMQAGGVMAYGKDERLYGTGKHGDKVHIALCLRDKGEEAGVEAEYVAKKIKELISTGKKNDGSPITPADIVIILRSMKNRASAFKDALDAQGIPCEDLATERFFESPEVLLVVSLLNVIDNPERDIYLAAALKSPLYGVTLSELVFIRKYAGGSLFDALRTFTEEKDFAKGKRFLADYERYREAARVKPCDELIWQIYLEKEILSLVSSHEDESMAAREAARANLLQLYNYARTFSGSAFRGLYDFLAFIADVIENGTKIDIPGSTGEAACVRIITSHQSKGLEYPVCFVSACGAALNKRDAIKDIIIDKELGIIPKIAASYGLERVNTPQRMAASFALAKSACNEEMRVLYVALTRAKEKLFITGEVRGKIEENSKKYNILPEHGKSFFEYEGEFFSPYSAANSSSFLDMILPAAAGRSDLCTSEIYCSGEDAPATEAEEIREEGTQEDETTYYAAKKLIEKRFSFRYPHAPLCSVPSKLSVSRLFPDVLDEDDGSAELEARAEENAEVPVPKFMRTEEERADGAKKGNATHLFMQFFDFDSVEKLGIEGEIARLSREKFIFESDAALINRYALSRFFAGPLAKAMKKSSRVYREKRFIINYPAENFSENEEMRESLRCEKLLVQGIIDCAFFDENGKLILVDYKTDSFYGVPEREAEAALRERHSRQIGYYKYACRELFGVPCEHAYIYSFALNKTIEI
ncbi:MAG: UvrD-helicase domain-containing protein [Clostridia bacterium]|nr:UvrD-helicase domain-containing protein [Clostridia bacterium]